MAETMPEYIVFLVSQNQPSFKLGSCFENVLKFHNNCPLQSKFRLEMGTILHLQHLVQ